jgi:hypothetical protein
VGIGVPKGRASYIYTHAGRWIIRYGVMRETKLVMETAKGSDNKPGFPTRKEAQEWYAANKQSFAVARYPQKIPFFTFTRRIVTPQGEELFEPDFDAIEAHGDTPRDIEVYFMSDDPFTGNYQAWSASELKCYGDGINAMRLVTLGTDKWPGWQESVDAKQKYFPVQECWVSGLCPYAQEGGHAKLVCKPNASVAFQLANSIRLGATAYCVTTGIRSTQQLFSSLFKIRAAAERAGGSIVGFPMRLVLAPYRTNHNGQAATQYGMSVEMRERDMRELQKALANNPWTPGLRAAAPKMLPSADEETLDITASEIAGEFYPEAVVDDEDVAPEEQSQAERATAQKTEALADKLNAAKKPAAGEPSALREELGKALAGDPVAAGATPPAGATTGTPPRNGPRNRDGQDMDVLWQGRIVDGFREALGEAEFHAVLYSVTGDERLSSITFANHKQINDAMTTASQRQRGAAEPVADTRTVKVPPDDGRLF